MQFLKNLIFVSLGLFITSFGLRLLAVNDFTFGGTAGIASVFTFTTNISWGVWFFLVNLPFFILSLQKLGKWFTLSTFFLLWRSRF